MAFAVLPFVMWAAIRFGMSVTALSIFLVASIATVETALGSGPFTTNTPLMNAVLLDIFFAVVSVTGLTLAAAVAERERAEGERERLVRERAEAEARLRFAAIVESSDDAIVSKTPEGDIVSWNKGAQQIYGYTEAEVVGRPISILVPPELVEEENEILEKLRVGDRIDHYETVRVTKTGKKINVSLTISPIKDSTGVTVGISGIARDITERKRAQEALRISEERLRLAQWAAHLGTFDVNLQTGVDIWQPETEAMYGLPPGGFGGTLTAFEALIHPADRERINELTQEMMRTGQPTEAEWRVIWPDGSVHWIAGRGQVFMDDSGDPSRMLGVNIDVSERKRVEERLREYEKAVEGAEDMIGVIDREYRFLLANRQYLRMRNLTREQVVGHFVPEILGTEIFETVIKPKLDECFQGRVVRYETKFSYPTVGERDLSLSYFPIEGANGVDRAACILRDITDRKRAEEALQNMSRKVIEAQEQERVRIARDLHDDVAQRLALLAIGLEQVEHSLPDSIPALHTSVAALRKQTTEISTDIQTMSHELHSSKLEYLGVVVAMKSFCKELSEQQKVEINFRNQDVPRSLPPEISLCLFRVLQEALHNAAKHSEVRRFEVLLRGDSHDIHLSISDSGRGFDPEAAMRGQGLGLISMRERVRLVNGTIKIESKPMSGTTIHVRVPFQEERLSKEKAV